MLKEKAIPIYWNVVEGFVYSNTQIRLVLGQSKAIYTWNYMLQMAPSKIMHATRKRRYP